MTTLLHIARCAAALGAAVGYLLTFAAVADAEPLIRLTGVVRSARVEADKIVLKVATPVSTITAHVSPHGIDSRHLADSAVRLAGVWTAGTPGPREPMTQIFAVTSLDIVTRGPRDPFDAPELSLQEVLHLSGREVPLHRVRIAGTVTAQFGGQSVYVSDGRHDIRLQTADAVSFKPGDVITLAGYISRSASPRELVETIVRKTDAVAAPVPIRIDSAGLLKTEHHNMLVRLEATVIRLSVDAHDQDLMLESDGMMFEGELENQDDPVLPTLIPGSRVEVTGIAHVATATSDDPGSLRILLREAADVRVLSRPTWWTVQRALYLLGVMIVGFVAAGGWIVALRRRFPVVERARIESERRYRELFDHAPAGHFVSDGNGTLTACNDAFARLVGFKSADAAIGASADSFHARDEDRGAWRELLHDGTPLQNRKVALRAVDGRVIHALETAVVQTDGHRRTVEIQGFLIDRTEQERAEASLRERDAQLQQAQKMEAIGRLAGGVAHDFNNLLTAISGYSDLAREECADRLQVVEYLDQVQKAAGTGAGLTRQLLAFSRKQVFEPAVIDLKAVVVEMDKMLRRLLGEDVCLMLSTSDGPLQVKADRAQIEQILVNLAVNARDAMPNGGALKVQAYGDAANVKLIVSDNGCGMDEHTMSHLFEPFFTTKAPGQGTGLGLAMVYGAVVQSGGTISVKSVPREGAKFVITMPRVDEPVDVVTAVEPAAVVRGSETILLVEDDAGVRNLTRRMLERDGYVVLVAAHGRGAMEAASLHDGPIDLLLTDVVMPEMSGIELAQRLTVKCPNTRVLFMSGYADHPALKRQPIPVRASVLQKPFTRGTLGPAVRQALHLRQPILSDLRMDRVLS